MSENVRASIVVLLFVLAVGFFVMMLFGFSLWTEGTAHGFCLANGFENQFKENGTWRCYSGTEILVVPDYIIDGKAK